MNRTPSVSVVVTAYNHEPYIAAALQSVLAQTYAPHEVIVVDDGSTDRTADVLAAFGATITPIRQPNMGVAGSRNTGVKAATGDVIAFMDGDDVWEPAKLARQVDAYNAHPDSGLIACDVRQFNGDVIMSDQILTLALPELRECEPGSITSRRCYRELIRGNFIATTSQIMIPRRVFADVGLSDDRLQVSSDYDLYLRIAAKYPFAFVREVLVWWRYLPTSATGPLNLRILRCYPDCIEALKKQLRAAPRENHRYIESAVSQRAAAAARRAYDYGSEFDARLGRLYLWRLFRQNPRSPMVALFLAGLIAPPAVRSLVGPWVSRALRPGTGV